VQFAAGTGQQHADLFVRTLLEICVEAAHGIEALGDKRTDNLISFGFEFDEGALYADGSGEDEPSDAGTDGAGGGTHAGAGGEAVIDEDYGAVIDGDGWKSGAKGLLHFLKPALFAGKDGLERLRRDAKGADDSRVVDGLAAAGDGADGEFVLAGSTELAYGDDVHGQVQCVGYFVGDRNAAAGQAENDGVLQIREGGNCVGENAAGFFAIVVHRRTVSGKILC